MKQKLLLTIALLCAVAQGAWSQRVVDLSTVSSGYVAQDGDVLTGETRETLYIEDGATVTFNNLTVSTSGWGVVCRGNACIILAEGTMNTVKANQTAVSTAINSGNTLTIKGTGSLHAESLEEGAGIGCDPRAFSYVDDDAMATIEIESGNITAIGCSIGAGIGYCGCWNMHINIKGGNITATGGRYCAGIGSDKDTNGGFVRIYGGTIVAKGGEEAAGIGGGEDGSAGNVFIFGGDVTAYGGEYAAGIGGGDGGPGGIYINGGTIKAYGGKDAAGIGGGEDGNSGFISIEGGNVYAEGKGYGVGIGAGEDGDVDHSVGSGNGIKINGGIVEAVGGEDIGRAIGGEDPEDYSYISIGEKYIRMSVTNVSIFGEQLLPSYYRGYILSSYSRLRFEPCKHAGATYSIVNAEKHQFNCPWCGNFEAEDHHFDENGKCHCGYGLPTHVVHIYEYGSNYQYYEANTLTVAEGFDFTLPPTAGGPDNYLFRGWVKGKPSAGEHGILLSYDDLIEPGTVLTIHDEDLYFMARYERKQISLASIDEDVVATDGMEISGNLSDNYRGRFRISIADGATVTLRDATILGTDSYDYLWCGINCLGDATIILEGKNTVRGYNSFYPGIGVAPGKTLTIQGDGSLDASSNGDAAGIGGGGETGYSCGNIIIRGGTIKATGGRKSAGIGAGKYTSCGDITISNKVTSVTAIKGEDAPHSIGASDGKTGTITIGKVKTGPISESPYTFYPSLDVSDDMTTDLEKAMGKTFDITFRGRKFIIDSEWNTLCLPFSMNAEQIGNSPLAKGKIVELDTEKTTLSNDVLTIAYKTATEIEAGKPYMVKWGIDEDTEDTHIDDPIFKLVTISAAAPTAVSAAGISFCGTFAPLTLASGDKTRLWLDDDVRLRWASGQDEQVSPTWCYWDLGNLDVNTLNAIVVTFDDDSRPIVELMDGMKDFSILSAFGEQEVNASMEGRELSAVQQEDGTWQSRAYTVCLPFYVELFGTGCDFTIYSKAEITQDGELLFTQEMLPFLYPGNAYLIVVNEGTLRLQEEGVTIIDEAKGADDDENGVLLNYEDNQIAGHWLGSLKTIGHDEAVSRHAYTMISDGSFQRITNTNPTWYWPAFRSMFCAKPNVIAKVLPTTYKLDANGEEDEDLSLPAPESYQGDNEDEATGIAPVIHTIDRDGTERWFDMNGRQLSGKPAKKGVYIHRGKKQVVK